MPDSMRRVSSGSKLRVPAATWNKLLDSVSEKSEMAGGWMGAGKAIPHLTAYGYNPFNSEIPAGSVLSILDIFETPQSQSQWNNERFFDYPAVWLDKWNDSPNPVVSPEEIKPKSFGKIVISGLTSMRVKTVQAGHNFAADDGTFLAKTAPDGPIPLIWKDPSVGNDRKALGLLIPAGGASTLTVGSCSATWPKGSTATVNPIYGSEPIAGVHNYFFNVAAGKSVAIEKTASGDWILIAAECGPETV